MERVETKDTKFDPISILFLINGGFSVITISDVYMLTKDPLLSLLIGSCPFIVFLILLFYCFLKEAKEN